MEMIKDWPGTVSTISDIVVAIAALIALQQITVLKKDIRLRNQRAAAEKAIEAVSSYAKFADLTEAFFRDLKAADVSTYKGSVSDFGPDSIPADWKPMLEKRVKIWSWVPAVNAMDTVAASFVFGVADESIGFSMIGRSFCANVGHFYDLMALHRSDAVQPHFQAIVRLYKMWSERLSKEQLRLARTSLDTQIAKLPNQKITPIGVNDRQID